MHMGSVTRPEVNFECLSPLFFTFSFWHKSPAGPGAHQYIHADWSMSSGDSLDATHLLLRIWVDTHALPLSCLLPDHLSLSLHYPSSKAREHLLPSVLPRML